MAVRHGYGKIAGADALVFAYDTGDTRNSYRGEPTENLANTDSLRTMVQYSDNTVASADAPEKGPGWKKVTVTARGTNFRTAKFPYITHPTNTTRTYSLEVDFNGTSGYYVRGDGFSGLGPNIYTSGVHSWTFTTTTNNGSMALFLNNGSTSVTGLNDVIYYRYYQVEDNAHRTQFTAGTRSATQGLLDLTGNRSIDLTNAGFDSNAQISLDGSSDYFEATSALSSLEGLEEGTVEVVFNWTSGDTPTLVHLYAGSSYYGLNLGVGNWTGGFGNESVYFYIFESNGAQRAASAYLNGHFTYRDGAYHHLVVTVNTSDQLKMYIDGEEVSLTSSSATKLTPATVSKIQVGRRELSSSPTYLAGEVPVTKIYNRALTAAEVKNNYNLYKTRFNI